MGRLIDADALLENAKKYVYQSDMTTTIALGIAETWIKDAPTVDAVPVVHGRWIGGELGMCSVCKREGCASDIFDMCDLDGQHYCPNCGAKLDLYAPTCGPDYCEIGGES